MAVDELLHALAREAEAEAEAIRAHARADAAELDRAGLRRATAHTDAVLADVRAKEQTAADAAVAAVARRRRRDVLVRRAAALERVHAAVTAALPSLLVGESGAAIVGALIGGVDAALAAAGGPAAEDVVVRCSPPLAVALRARLGARPGLSVIADETIAGGLIAERSGGAVTIDARLGAFLERWWPALRVSVRPPDRADAP